MVVRRVVPVKPIVHHLIDKPSVDTLIKMRRLDAEQEKPQKRCQSQDRPWDPVRRRQLRSPLFHAAAQSRDCRRIFCWRALLSAASTRCHAHPCNRWLRIHWEQFYSVYFATLQACVCDQRGCAHLRGQSRQSQWRGRRTWRALRIFQADIANADQMDALMTEHRFYAVINFAAESHVDRSINDPLNFIHTNVIGTSVLLDCARRHGVQRFIQISTDEVYGSLGPTGRFTEQSPLDPSSPYSASKAGADLLALASCKTYGQEVLVTRCSNNYGP